jgi:hypothetical protein
MASDAAAESPAAADSRPALPVTAVVNPNLPGTRAFYVCSLETGDEAILISWWLKRKRGTG